MTSLLHKAALQGLETAINRCLRLDPVALQRTAALAGKVIEIRLQGPGLRFYLSPGRHGIRVAETAERAADTVITATPLALLRAGLAPAHAAPFSGEIRVEGDLDAGRELRAILTALDIDWEEQLSRLVGDVAAHQIGNAARSLARWLARSALSLQDDLGDYLREESRLLPNPDEVEALLSAIDVLRADTDRLEQRIIRLEQKLGVRPAAGSSSQGLPDALQEDDG